MTTLTERVRDAVGQARAGYEEAGYEGPMPGHGQAGGAKWLVSEPGTEPTVWEGGYVCHCGEVFVSEHEQGSLPTALVALLDHEHTRVAA